ncbi:type II toxin-antitoxin system Phd/YefM family antitoxin [Nocardia sp. R6R-6]|uniref:type II toxin-antitoxin system Phd/YefM family antitoxin n=1 Tax=Nocardia sp. R6R-6 TaxID=3459303 RepID=UPI00403E18E2
MTRIISQAELCDESSGVLDALEAGEDFIITRNGHPVGELRPLTPTRGITTAELKRRLALFARSDSSAAERAQVDAVFGEDRIEAFSSDAC